MSPVVVAIAALALGSVFAVAALRLRRGNASVEHYQQAMRALHDVTDAHLGANGDVEIGRQPGSSRHVRVLEGSLQGPPLRPAQAEVPGDWAATGAPPEPGVVPPSGLLLLPGLSLARSRRSRISLSRRSLRNIALIVTAAAVGTLLVVVAAPVLVSNGAGRAARHVVVRAAAGPATLIPVRSDRPKAPPPPTSVVVTGSTPGAVSYTISSSQLTLTMSASKPCWIELRSASSSGQLLYAGTLAAGTEHSFVGHSGIWLRLGYPPGVQVSVDGQLVGLPSTNSPLDVSLASA